MNTFSIRTWAGAALVVALSGMFTTAGRGADLPSRPHRSWFNPLRYRDAAMDGADRIKQIEGVEMVLAVASGSQMGPGEGWFHGSQSRYSWSWLADRCGGDKQDKITRKDFPGDDALFDRLDRNRDGVLTADDFDWSENSPFLRQAGAARSWFALIDSNSNGRISKKEWDAFFERAAKGKDHVTAEDLREALMRPASPPGKDGGGPSPFILIKGLMSGELGSFHEGPRVGQRAPNFRLKTHDDKQEVTLGQFKGKKPVVLIFGSFT